jgi:F-type H+-transporting ATPase subunit a
MMRKILSCRYATTLAIALGLSLFAFAAYAQDHGHDDAHAAPAHAAEAQAHDTTAAHGEAYPDDPHGHDPAVTHADPHGADAHGDAHGDPHAVDAHGDAHAADAHDAHGDAHGGGHGAMPHLPSALTFIEQVVPAPVAAKLDAFKDPIFSLFMALVLAGVFVSLSQKLDARNPGRLQMAVEMLLGGLYSLFRTIIGEDARKYTPFLGSLFIFILCNNLFGLIPLGHAATSSFANTTFALGALTFLYVQFIALRLNGVKGYLFHLAGSPKSGVEWALTPLFFPLHVVGELIKPVSLSLRLFGNIFGEDTLVATMVLLGAGISYSVSGGMAFVPGLPLQFPFYFLGLLSCTIQALVFTLLATVYIALWLPHEHHDEAHGH